MNINNVCPVGLRQILQKYKRDNFLKGSSCFLTSDSCDVAVYSPILHFSAVTTFPPSTHTLKVNNQESLSCVNKQITITRPVVLALTDSSHTGITIYNTTDQLLATFVKFEVFKECRTNSGFI